MAKSQRTGCLPVLALGAMLWIFAVQPHIDEAANERQDEQIAAALDAMPDSITMPDLFGEFVISARRELGAQFDAAINDTNDLDLTDDISQYDTLRDGWRAAGAEFERPEDTDLSPRGRNPEDGWIVQATRPGPGEPVGRDTVVWLFALRPSEVAWFDANAAMPAVQAGLVARDLTSPGGQFEPVAELLDVRYAEQSATPQAPYQRMLEGLVPPNPAKEPDSEWQARTALREAHGVHAALTVGQIPAPGTALRRGQLPVVTIVDAPRPEAPALPGSLGGSWAGDGRVYVDDGDDDFNIPGWLCPTRFC